MTEQQQDRAVAVPESLVALANESKPTNYAQGLIEHFKPDIMNALNYDMIAQPRQGALSYESFMASAKLEVAENERLARAMLAAPGSFIKALLLAAQTKLLVGSGHGLFWLVPRYNKKLGCEEVTSIIGYRGLCELATRHPRVHKVEAHLVFEGEEFSYDAGAGKLTHKVNLLGERTEEKMLGGYARVVITDPAGMAPVLDDPIVMVKSRDELLKIKHSADSWKQGEKSVAKGWTAYDPWHVWPLAMHRKSLLRAVMNGGSVPRDMGLGGAITADDQAQITPADEQPKLPTATRGDEIAQQLGIEETPEPFGDCAEAIEALNACQTQDECRALRGRWDHFQGLEAQEIAEAYEERMFILEEDEGGETAPAD